MRPTTFTCTLVLCTGSFMSWGCTTPAPAPTDSARPDDAGSEPVAVCGDGRTDPPEQCDDGNEVAWDGCEPDCTFTCEADLECDDGDPCNDAERCADHRCVAGDGALDDGSSCSAGELVDGTCRAGVCISRFCGNGLIDPGEDCDDANDVRGDGCEPESCTWTCSADEDCADGDACDGVEACDLASHTCLPGAPLVCDDGDACTADGCEPALGCTNERIDADGDGFAARALGACGSDCDDARADVYPGAPETCDGIDNDCNGVEDDGIPTWYPDCDRDGYAAAGAVGVVQCVMPATPPSGCTAGGWTTRNPDVIARTADCADRDATRHPAATERPGDEIDANCDGRELCYSDADDDGHRPPSGATRASLDLDCGDAFEARASDPADDCCDTDADARPGATAYHTTARDGCGGFDYDCSGAEERRYGTHDGRCDARDCGFAPRPGWVGSSPDCGTVGVLAVCRTTTTTCALDWASATASCR